MINPEMVPQEVCLALKATLFSGPGHDIYATAIAAALNAWPGMHTHEWQRPWLGGMSGTDLILPLAQKQERRMSDIVEKVAAVWDRKALEAELAQASAKMVEQAARIEQLEAEAKTRTLDYLGQVGQLSDEIERLRAALREIAGNPRGGKINTPEKFDRDEFIAIARAALEGK